MSLNFGMLFVIWQQLTDTTSITKHILRNDAELSKIYTGGCVSTLPK